MYDRTPFPTLGERFCKTNKTKIPLQASGTPAKVNDNETWSNYSEIIQKLRQGEMLGVFLGPGDDGFQVGYEEAISQMRYKLEDMESEE